jgi:hypothetical protein
VVASGGGQPAGDVGVEPHGAISCEAGLARSRSRRRRQVGLERSPSRSATTMHQARVVRWGGGFSGSGVGRGCKGAK